MISAWWLLLIVPATFVVAFSIGVRFGFKTFYPYLAIWEAWMYRNR